MTIPLRDGADARAVTLAVNRILAGGLNVTGQVTLSAGATETALSDRRIGGASVILLMPETEAAASALSKLHVRIDGAARATLIHLQPASDRRFRYVVLG